MRVLAIETAGTVLGVAAAEIESGGNPWIGSPAGLIEHDTAFRHTEALVPTIRTLLEDLSWAPSTLDGVLVGAGPGSFTGLRVGMAAAKGIALAANAPVVSVDTLDAVAFTRTACEFDHSSSSAPGIVVALIDARKKRYYAALYRCTGPPGHRVVERISDNLDATPRELEERIIAARTEQRDNGAHSGSGSTSWRVAGNVTLVELREFLSPEIMASAVELGVHRPTSAVDGVLRRGIPALLRGEYDDPWAGPRYLRTGDVGKPKAYPRFDG